MAIRLALLKSGETVISDIKELVSKPDDDGNQDVYGYMFLKPHKVSVVPKMLLTENLDSDNREYEITLSPWILLTEDDKIPVTTDYVVTVVNPVDSLERIYLEKTREVKGE
jgi:hypothetical protein